MITFSSRSLAVASGLVLALAVSSGCSSDAGGPAALGGSGVTGTVTFDGGAVEPLDDLSCVKVEGNARIAGGVGEDGFISIQSGSASYMDGETEWTSTSGDDKGDLEVTEEGASGTILMYDRESDTASDEREFVELTADLTC